MVELTDVSVKYKKTMVVKQASFKLGNGAYGLLGPNGAGKTTLLRAIGCVLPYEGSMVIHGAVGYLPQQFGIYNELKVSEAMEYFALLCQVPNKEIENEIERGLELTNMKQYADKRVGKLSGGMLRRLGIAQALLGKPDLLLLDEPTTGLDPEERMRLKLLVNTIKNDCTIIISTHIVEDVADICDGLMIMHKGRILEQEKGPIMSVGNIKTNLEEYYLSCIHDDYI